MDYKQTLNLPETAFPMKADLARREPDVQKFWEEQRIYDRLRQVASGRPTYILLEETEEAPFREHFRGQSAGALDWPPRAVVAGRGRVRLYDPSDRQRIRRGEDVVTIYVPAGGAYR